jgi:multidrug resistance protein, MATE family
MSSSRTLNRGNALQFSKYPVASLRELLKLSIPLMLILFAGNLMSFCDRLFVAHYSFEALESCVNGTFLCTLFQLPCIRITSMSQVFVGLQKGAKQLENTGECIWQMIWFSLLSMILTVPLSIWTGRLCLHGTSVEAQATTYFHCLMWVNFLFPLGAALASFYVGQGKTKILLVATLATHLTNVIFDYFLIFGVGTIIPPLGVQGAAIATAIAQAVFCIILFSVFITKKNKEIYHTHQYRLKWKSFWNYINVGIPRALARMVLLSAWVAIARIITLKGGDFLMVLSLGSTLFLLFSFMNEGMSQAMISMASTIIGAGEPFLLKKLIKSAFSFLSLNMLILAIPFLIFPKTLISFFFSEHLHQDKLELLNYALRWIWIAIFANGINFIGTSLLSAAKDTVFHMCVNCFTWVTSYLPVFCAYNLWNWPADKLWLLIALDGFIFGIIFLWRFVKQPGLENFWQDHKPQEDVLNQKEFHCEKCLING